MASNNTDNDATVSIETSIFNKSSSFKTRPSNAVTTTIAPIPFIASLLTVFVSPRIFIETLNININADKATTFFKEACTFKACSPQRIPPRAAVTTVIVTIPTMASLPIAFDLPIIFMATAKVAIKIETAAAF